MAHVHLKHVWKQSLPHLLTHKPVPCAVLCEEAGRILRMSFQFLPELQDVGVDCPQRRIVVVTQRFFFRKAFKKSFQFLECSSTQIEANRVAANWSSVRRSQSEAETSSLPSLSRALTIFSC